jgi:hypothetical protein
MVYDADLFDGSAFSFENSDLSLPLVYVDAQDSDQWLQS